MNEDLEDSLKHLVLRDGVEGMQRLKPEIVISEVLLHPPQQCLHIVVVPPSGELRILCF